jgi:hypothetical protein
VLDQAAQLGWARPLAQQALVVADQAVMLNGRRDLSVGGGGGIFSGVATA